MREKKDRGLFSQYKVVPLVDSKIKKLHWADIKPGLSHSSTKANDAVKQYQNDKKYNEYLKAAPNNGHLLTSDIVYRQGGMSDAGVEASKQNAINAINAYNATIHMANRYLELKGSPQDKKHIKRQQLMDGYSAQFNTFSQSLQDSRVIAQPAIVHDIPPKKEKSHHSEKVQEIKENVNATLGGIPYNIKQAEQVIKESVETLSAGGSVKNVISQAKAVLNDQSDVHQEVLKLYNETKAIYDKTPLKPEVKEAAVEFISKLDALLKADKSDPMSKKAEHRINLATKTIELMDEYKPALEVASGFWNQLKHHFNTFIENSFGIKDALGKPEGTKFSESMDFQKYRSTMRELRTEKAPEERVEAQAEEGVGLRGPR